MNRLFKAISAAVVFCTFGNVWANAAELEGYSYSINKAGEVYNEFTRNGNWNKSEFSGYDNMAVYVTNDSGATAVWDAHPSQIGYKQEVYIWKSVMRNADKNATITVSTNTENIEKKLDFSDGYAGWVRAGVVNLPDIFIRTTLTASGEGALPASAIKFIKTDDAEYNADRIFDKNDDLMIIKIDSDKCIYNHEKLYLSDSKPTVINSRTMIPLRFVSENMGGDVVWNADERSVKVEKDGNVVMFYIDSPRYTVNGEERFFDTAPMIINSRTMIPLRALSEGLGCVVDYYENGLVMVGKNIVYDDIQKEQQLEALNEVLGR